MSIMYQPVEIKLKDGTLLTKIVKLVGLQPIHPNQLQGGFTARLSDGVVYVSFSLRDAEIQPAFSYCSFGDRIKGEDLGPITLEDITSRPVPMQIENTLADTLAQKLQMITLTLVNDAGTDRVKIDLDLGHMRLAKTTPQDIWELVEISQPSVLITEFTDWHRIPANLVQLVGLRPEQTLEFLVRAEVEESRMYQYRVNFILEIRDCVSRTLAKTNFGGELLDLTNVLYDLTVKATDLIYADEVTLNQAAAFALISRMQKLVIEYCTDEMDGSKFVAMELHTPWQDDPLRDDFKPKEMEQVVHVLERVTDE